MKRIELKKSSKDELIDLILEKDKELSKKDKAIEKLEKEIKKYKNANTPSSAHKHIKPNTMGLQSKKTAKRGAPKDHNGKTRIQIADNKEVIDSDTCPRCHGHNVKDHKIRKRIIEDIPEPVIPEVKENEIHEKECEDCGLRFIPPENKVPLKGKFGINLMIMVIFLKFLLRGVLRKTSTFLNSGFAFKITPSSINAIIKRVADAAENEFEELKSRIRNAKKVYVDETSFSVLGKNQWVWVFRTKEDILLVIRPSRGSNVLAEIVGQDYAGIVICDCWRAYNSLSFATLQRCWAHLLRKSRELCDTIVGYNFHSKLQRSFEEIKEFNQTNPTKEQRLVKYEDMTKRLKKIVYYYAQYEELNAVANYVLLNLENWFTCVKYPDIEPTNNFAEQAIRETVMVRKIIGAFRSETGKHNYETLASLISTWQLQKLDLKTELKRMLTKNLCFS